MRKILVILLSTSLLFGTFDLERYIGGFSNQTNPQESWSLKEGSLVTGGSYEYRYNFSGNMKPVFSGRAPSVKISCGSISIDGGFLAFIGLDDIETQFTDASAAFAFGFMSALELTMPEIAAVIAKLQEWARKLQQLLAGSCQSGKNVGGAFFKSLANTEAGKGVSEMLDSTMNPATKLLGYMDTVEETFSSSNTNATPPLESKKKDIVKKIGGSSSFLLGIFGNQLPSRKNDSDASATLIQLDANLKDFLENKKIGTLTLENNTAFEEKRDVYLLLKILFGDVVASDEMVKGIKHYFPDGIASKEALRNDVERGVFGNGDKSDDVDMGAGVWKATPYSVEEIATAFMIGFSALNDDGSNIVKVPNNKIMFIDSKIDSGAPGKVINNDGNSTAGGTVITDSSDPTKTDYTIKTLLLLDTTASPSTFDIKFDGFYEGSRKAIVAKVKDQSISWDTITVPNAVPGMGGYLKTLRTMWKKNPSVANFEVETMINNLAKLNAYYITNSFLSKVETMIKYHKNNTKVSIQSKEKRELMENLKTLSVRIKEIKEALKGKIPKLSDMPSVSEDFKNMALHIKQNTLIGN